MLSLEKLREIEPELKDISEKELEKIRDQLYSLANLALETYFDDKEKNKI